MILSPVKHGRITALWHADITGAVLATAYDSRAGCRETQARDHRVQGGECNEVCKRPSTGTGDRHSQRPVHPVDVGAQAPLVTPVRQNITLRNTTHVFVTNRGR